MWDIFEKGGPVMYPLLACSIIALGVVIDRAVFWIKLSLQRKPSLVDEVLELSQQGDWQNIKGKTIGTKDYIIKIGALMAIKKNDLYVCMYTRI